MTTQQQQQQQQPKTRYLTKSRFKLATECPAKLFYTGKAEYADSMQGNDFLASLAEGGYQVGELAKLMFPGGVEITAKDQPTQLQHTQELLAQESVVLFEPALSFERLFVRVDVLDKQHQQVRLIEVKSKSYDPLDETFFRGAKGQISTALRPYLLDIAFQTYVARQAMPGLEITPYLMVPDKSKAATVDGLNQMFPIQRLDALHHRVSASPRPGLTLADVGTPVMTLLNVAEYVNEILTTVLEVPGAVGPFASLASQWAEAYANDVQIAPPVQSQCKACEFRAPPGSALKSGLHACWAKALHLSDEELAQPLVLDLWDGRGTAKWMRSGVHRLKDLSMDDIGYKPDSTGLSRTQRQWLQISGEGLAAQDYLFNASLVREAMQTWVYPLNLIDFETSRTALPFHKGGKPFELVAFQFSHHVLHADGSLEHYSEFLSTTPGQHPNLDFLRALQSALSSNTGTILMWSPYENSVLNGLAAQIEHVGNRPADADALIRFVRSITVKKEAGQVVHQGARAMVDLCEIAKSAFFHKATNGSSSIKKVLPAMLQASSFLRKKYNQPMYGGGLPNSKNFKEPMAWWQADANGLALDPYKLLPPVFSDLAVSTDTDDDTVLNQGGAAIMAYARLQFETISPAERSAWESALLKYCELDTLAMAMILEGWVDWVRA